ncbi:hypothetical protein CQE65_13730 [Salmonella enterica subsp. enterica serovar Typhimurium]|nr:hypothetical protein [Salmonella enterica subsp. enterica serovar Typhimurium]
MIPVLEPCFQGVPDMWFFSIVLFLLIVICCVTGKRHISGSLWSFPIAVDASPLTGNVPEYFNRSSPSVKVLCLHC